MAKRPRPKFYVVWRGARPGIYDSWPAANAQVAGFPGARYKSFSTRAEAERAYEAGPALHRSPNASADTQRRASSPGGSGGSIRRPSLSVDAACSGNPGRMEYQGVSTATRERIFHRAFPVGTNNVGEFLAIVHGLAWCQANGLPDMPIYTDSRIAMGWVAKRKCKTTLPRDARTAELLDLVRRGEMWLEAHDYANPILKWDTKRWGEIPADFGRK